MDRRVWVRPLLGHRTSLRFGEAVVNAGASGFVPLSGGRLTRGLVLSFFLEAIVASLVSAVQDVFGEGVGVAQPHTDESAQ
jgi:hypothetical protein